MKTCLVCGRAAAANLAVCIHCGSRLPEGKVMSPDEEAANISYLVDQLDSWVASRWISEQQAHTLRTEYARRRTTLLFGNAADQPAPAPAPLAGPGKRSPYDVDLQRDDPQHVTTDVTRPRGLAGALMEDANLSYWHIIGAVLVLVGLGSIVAYTYSTGHKAALVALLLTSTALFACAPMLRVIRENMLTATALRCVAALLVPLDMVAILADGFFGWTLSTAMIGLAASVAELAIAVALTMSFPARAFAALTSISVVASLHFTLQSLLPGLMHTHDSTRLISAYGIAFGLLAMTFDAAAVRMKADDSRTPVIRLAGIVVMVGSVVASLATIDEPFVLNLPLTLLIAALLTVRVALRDNLPQFAFIGGALALGTILAALDRGGISLARAWYAYAMGGAGLVWVFYGLEKLATNRNVAATTAAFRGVARFMATITLGCAGLITLWVAFQLPELTSVRILDLWGLFVVVLTLLSYAGISGRVPPPTLRGTATYLLVVLALLAAKYMPASSIWHKQPNIGLALAVASAIWLWGFRERRAALSAATVAMLPCVLCAVTGELFETTVTAFVVLLIVIGSDFVQLRTRVIESADDAILGTWLTLGIAVALVFEIESRLLPYLRVVAHVEPNFGYALLLLTGIALLLAVSWPNRDSVAVRPLHQFWGVGTITTLLMQLWYANQGMLVSPLLLLAVSIGINYWAALKSDSPMAAELTTSLIGGAYWASWLLPGRQGTARDFAVTGALIIVGVLIKRLGVGRGVAFARAMIVCGLGAYLHLAHALLHFHRGDAPLVTLPAVAVLAYVAWRRRESADRDAPITPVVVATALAACVCAFTQLFDTPSLRISWECVGALVGYGAIFVLMANAYQSAVYIYLAGAALGIATVGILDIRRPLVALSQVAFAISISAVAWIAPVTFTRGRLWCADACRNVATVLAGCTGLLMIAAIGDQFSAFSLSAVLISYAVVLWTGYEGRRSAWLSAAPFVGLVGIMVQLGTPSRGSQFDLASLAFIPVGILAVGVSIALIRRVGERLGAPHAWIGLLFLSAPGLNAVIGGHNVLIAGGITAVLNIAFIFYGLASRQRSFVVAPTVFLALLLLVAAKASGGVAWAGFVVGLGLLVMFSAVAFARKAPSAESENESATHDDAPR
ncbi:MAG TPA: hypothetical protein VGK19_12735 [Capsulimonadaceae bacterium]|jgi:hypothetical protein